MIRRLVEKQEIRALKQERRENSRQQKKECEAADERRADEILQRLHDEGMESLTADDRAVLERVSMIYRKRSRNTSS